jgi:hypothetical protein
MNRTVERVAWAVIGTSLAYFLGHLILALARGTV